MLRFFLISIFVFAPLSVFAAPVEFPNLGEPLIIDIAPASAGPGEAVTVTINSYLLDLDRAGISWFVNGVQKDEGEGKTEFAITLGRSDTETSLDVRVIDISGGSASFSTILRPVELELLWEGDTYTPPLYRGRALPSPDGRIVAHAEARFFRTGGARVTPTDIIYTWRFNGTIRPESGRGRSAIRIPILGLYGEDTVSVDAKSVDGRFFVSKTVRVPLQTPHLTLYRSHPLLGIDYHNALRDLAQVQDAEITVAALPFFAHVKSIRDRDLLYTWKVAGRDIPSDAINPFLLTLSAGPDTIGFTPIQLDFDHLKSALQTARKLWRIELAPGAALSSDPFSRSVE